MDEGTLARMVGAAMAGRRKQRGYTQAQMAERLSISQESLSRMENGLISPKFSRLQDIADALDCSVAELFRTPSDSVTAHGRLLADLIRPLDAEGQEAVIGLVKHMVNAMLAQSRRQGPPSL